MMRAVLFLSTIQKESGFQKLFYTHPIAERVARPRKNVKKRGWQCPLIIDRITVGHQWLLSTKHYFEMGERFSKENFLSLCFPLSIINSLTE